MPYSMYQRWQAKTVYEALSTRRVLVLAGPRQCGKTTLITQNISKNALYRSLDDRTLLEAALSDPQGFVAHGDELMIIDEVQRAPSLLLAVKQDVDQNQKPGRFLLTGSANIQSLPGVSESLAGRVRKIRLRTLAQGELYNKAPDFIKNSFVEKWDLAQQNKSEIIYNKDRYIVDAFRGGYPEVLRFELDKDRRQWHKDYIEALMDRDLKEIVNIRRQDHMQKLLEVLAAWSSKFIDLSAIGSSLGLARSTIESYINALEALYLIERVRPWSKTDYDRVNKQDKLFITDPGLMTSILGWRYEDVRLNGELNGKLLETFVFTQLMAIIEAQEEMPKLYHYRDREKREIDFIVENERGDLLGIEVKAGSAVSKDSFKHLKWFKENLAKEKKFIGIILYTGEISLSFGEGMWAIPMNRLWA